MVLNDAEIIRRVTADGLIRGHDAKNVRNCAYILRAGRAFDPGSGHEVIPGQASGSTIRRVWEVGPAETLVVMTEEQVAIPNDLCASYAPLHRHATSGLMLMNPAVVEPLYDGHLSCFLLNFSSHKIQIAPGEEISKIIFHSLTAGPTDPQPLRITADKYQQQLAKAAARYHRSFLDVTGIEDRAAAKANAAVKNSLIAGGAIVGLLVLWASLEPVTTKWLWEKTGVLSTTQRTQDAQLAKDLETARALLVSSGEVRALEERARATERELAEVRRRLDALLAAGPPGTAPKR